MLNMQLIVIKREQEERAHYLEQIAKQIMDNAWNLKSGEAIGFVLHDFSPWAVSLIVDYMLMDERLWESIQLTYDEDLENDLVITRLQTSEGILQILVRTAKQDEERRIYYIHIWKVK